MLSTLFSYFITCTGLLALYTLGRCIYNLFFHPLAKFPGPKFAAISNIWYSLHWLGGRWPYDIDELHKKYGDVVRIAPNDLSFATLQSWQDIYGHAVNGHKYFLKGEWYQRSGSGNGIVSERDPVKHREVRKSLAHAFSAKALRDQTAVALKYINMFVDQIGKLGTQDEGISMEEWYNWLTFDIIGDLAFGESFGAVEKARSHFWVELILNSTFLGSFQDVLKRLPILKVLAPLVIPRSMAAQHKRHWELTQEMVAGRMMKENDRIDFFSHLLSEKATDLSRGFLMGQANTLIVAGSETTATALAGITHYLLNDLDKLRTLTKEVREAFSESSLINSDSTQHLQYLFAVIEEGLRLFPLAPFGLQRISPGAVIDDNYIPEGITVSTAIYTTSRRERYFYDAKSFHPERWLPANHPLYDSAFANDKKEASKPFSMGPRVCLGINLAYMEMRLALCKLVWHFDLELINKDINWERDTRLYLLWKKPKLMVKFTPVVR